MKAKRTQPDWRGTMAEDLRKEIPFRSLTQGVLTEAQLLAGTCRILKHRHPECLKSPVGADGRLTGKQCTCIMAEVGRRLMRAIVEGDTKFIRQFRAAIVEPEGKRPAPWRRRDIIKFLITCRRKIRGKWTEPGHEVDACRTKREIWRLIKAQFPEEEDFRKWYRFFDRHGLPVGVRGHRKPTPYTT